MCDVSRGRLEYAMNLLIERARKERRCKLKERMQSKKISHPPRIIIRICRSLSNSHESFVDGVEVISLSLSLFLFLFLSISFLSLSPSRAKPLSV